MIEGHIWNTFSSRYIVLYLYLHRYLDPPVEGPSPGEQELIAWLLLGEAAEELPQLAALLRVPGGEHLVEHHRAPRPQLQPHLQGVISAKSVWELFIGVKKVCDKICQKLQYKVLFMAKIALNKSYGGNNGWKMQQFPSKTVFLVRNYIKIPDFS